MLRLCTRSGYPQAASGVAAVHSLVLETVGGYNTAAIPIPYVRIDYDLLGIEETL